MDDKKLISLEIPETLRKDLKKEAYERDLSVSAVIRYILEEYFKSKNNGI